MFINTRDRLPSWLKRVSLFTGEQRCRSSDAEETVRHVPSASLPLGLRTGSRLLRYTSRGRVKFNFRNQIDSVLRVSSDNGKPDPVFYFFISLFSFQARPPRPGRTVCTHRSRRVLPRFLRPTVVRRISPFNYRPCIYHSDIDSGGK